MEDDLMKKESFSNQIFQKFEQLDTLIDRMVEPLTQELALSHNALMVLYYIYEYDEMSMKQLQSKLNHNQGNLSTLCKKLEARELLHRTRKKEDERSVTLSLSEQGKATMEDIFKRSLRVDEKLITYDDQKKESILQGLDDLMELVAYITKGEHEHAGTKKH